jgi:hypothetical protein
MVCLAQRLGSQKGYFVIEFGEVIGDPATLVIKPILIMRIAAGDRKEKLLLSNRCITHYWSGQYCEILVLS